MLRSAVSRRSRALRRAQRPLRQTRSLNMFGPEHLKLSEAEMSEAMAKLDNSKALPRLKRPSAQMFASQVRPRNNPIVLMELMLQWPALVRWTDPGYFKLKFGQAQIPIEVGRNFGGAPGPYSQEMVSISTFVDVYINKTKNKLLAGDIAFMSRHPIFEQLPALKEDIKIPLDFIQSGPGDKLEMITASWGPAKSETALRRDPYNYLIAETVGARYCRLYAPSATVYPHTNPFYKNISMVDISKPDPSKFPDFATAHYQETVLRAGEMLFVPKGWWLYTKSLAYGFSVNFVFSSK